MAATGLWSPPIGTDAVGGPPSTSEAPVPAKLTEVLGVLRRPPTAEDRSDGVEATLRRVRPGHGVRPESVRYLAPGLGGQATILLSAEKAIPNSKLVGREPVCLSRPMIYEFDGKPVEVRPLNLCFGVGALLAGQAIGGTFRPGIAPRVYFGLVPDGVATVAAKFGGGPDSPGRTAAVTNNYWEMPLPRRALFSTWVLRTIWRDAEGNVVPQRPEFAD